MYIYLHQMAPLTDLLTFCWNGILSPWQNSSSRIFSQTLKKNIMLYFNTSIPLTDTLLNKMIRHKTYQRWIPNKKVWSKITCDHTLPPCIQRRKRRAWYIYLTDRMFKNQILVFSLIGRETILLNRCVLIGRCISIKLPVKKSDKMADTEWCFSEDEFSTALRYFKYDSLKEELIECLQRVICLREDVLVVLPTGFGKSLIYQIIPKVLECWKNESMDYYPWWKWWHKKVHRVHCQPTRIH